MHLLANPNHLFDLDARDVRGQTLISLVLDTKNEDLLKSVLAKKIKVNQPTYKTRNQILVQPLHQAVTMNFAEGVRLLAQHHAQLNNPVGPMRDTPLLLAARQGKMKSLQVLLEFPPKHLALEAENTHSIKNQQNGLRAIEELCIHFKNKQQTQEALRSIAMLLCCGAEPPRSEEMRHLLSSNRVALLKAVDVFLKDKPQYVDAFVNRCHLKESALHNIVYADHSWSSSIRHLFGKPSDAALVREGFVTKKYSNPLDKPRNAPQISSIAGSEAGVDDPLKLYAEFVRRYTDTYNNQKIANRWSTMRWMIAEGKADWEIVCRYAENHPSSRTHLVLTEMCPAQPSMHEDIDVENAASPEFSH